jgi:hypothetical protein
MTESDVVVTEADVESLNRASIVRAAAFVRIAGSVLVVVGALGAVAWLWTMVRTQQQAGARFEFSDSGALELDLVDRVDILAPYVGVLATTALVVGFGLLLRLVSDFVVARSGGTLSGFEAGDVLDEDVVEVELEET